MIVIQFLIGFVTLFLISIIVFGVIELYERLGGALFLIFGFLIISAFVLGDMILQLL